MKASEVKVGHVYYVDFEPTRRGEFDKHHLAVVLKKNKNEITFIVIPLTSSKEGENANKVKLHITDKLPEHLRSKETYAVYDQIRTVNASRFQVLREGDDVIDAVVSEEDMDTIYEKIIGNLIFNLSEQQKTKIKERVFKTT